MVVASTNPIWLTGFLHLVEGLRAVELVGVSETARDALGALEEMQPDMLVLDLRLVEPLRALHRPRYRVPRVVIVGDRAHSGTRPSFGRECTCGYFNERVAWPEISDGLAHVARCTEERAGAERCQACPVARSHRRPRLPLSDRETEVFERLGWGEGPSAIARSLGLQVKTVDSHREALKHKLGLRSALELRDAAAAWRDGHLLPGVVVDPA